MFDLIDIHHITHTKIGVISALGSIISVMIHYFTQSNIAFIIGILAGAFSIYNSYLSIKEKKASIRKMQEDKIKHIRNKTSK